MKKAFIYIPCSLLCTIVSIYLFYRGVWIIHAERFDEYFILFRALGQLLIALPFLLMPLAHVWMYRLIEGCKLHRHFLWFPSILFLICWLYSQLGWVITGIWTPWFTYFADSDQFLLLSCIVFAALQIVMYRFLPKS